MFKCDFCNYTTNRLYNLNLHKNRKKPCYMNINNFVGNTYSENDKRHECYKCQKSFVRLIDCKHHENICEGMNPLQCKTCLKTFTTSQGKWQHNKNVNCKPHQTVHTINNHITNQNITNTQNNTQNNIQNTIQINCFGKEDLSYLLHDNNLIYRINNYSKDGVYGLVKMIDEIYMNKDKPENNTILKLQDRGDGVYIRNNDDWEYREFEDIRDNLVSSLDKYFDIYQQKKKGYDIKLIEKKERRRIKKFLTTLMTIGGILNKELCEELEIEDEDEEDKTMKKFDNATKEKLHQRSMRWKKINGKIENTYQLEKI